MSDEPYTIKQELDLIGIEPTSFNIFYNLLEENKKVPLKGGTISEGNYAKIITYLKLKKVLDKTESILEEGFKIFSSKRRLENIMTEYEDSPNPRTSGGIVSCRDSQPLSNGGVAPCRSDDYEFDGGLPGLVTKSPED